MDSKLNNIVDFEAARAEKLADVSLNNVSAIYNLVAGKPVKLPLYASAVRAGGFENPASDYIESDIDPTEYLIDNPNAAMLLRVKGDSMIEAEIFDGDIIVADTKIEAHVGDIVVAETDEGYTVKYLGKHCLIPGNPNYPTMYFKDMQELRLVGVVISKMKRLKRR
ncbi:LexA family transcriptional regulator [Methylophilus sp. QUAN]|uniref:LexA family protein n=1 Tax=Methylophilus sp. QUAN TaxID=2781020 RepID=UPI00188FDC5F|nr:S24 family peptidase [Methylophilus sp. QUAN]MBF4991111.1 peptidase S24 and S26 domain protein [Methylophilus sp. QUAN]